MTIERTYLDHNATSPLLPEAREAMIAALEVVGNASSVHREGRRARALVEAARESVAALVGARPDEIVFTSGATEANNWVVRAGWETVLTTAIEHESVLAPAQSCNGGALFQATARPDGIAAVETIAAHMLASRPGSGRMLASLQMANSETGVVQRVSELAQLGRAHDIVVHSDAVQAVGRVAVDFAALGLDLMSVSAHKLGGPKGVGALVIRDGLDIPALLSGGGQERRRRAGTENVAAIAGFGAAAQAAGRNLGEAGRLAGLRDRLEDGVREITPDAVVVGAESPRLCNTSCIALPGEDAAVLLIKLDLAGVAVSAGSACSSGKIGGSHVLAGMGIDKEVARAAIRVSLGPSNSERDVERFLEAWRKAHLTTRPRVAAPTISAAPAHHGAPATARTGD